ncbi:JAB domain-containing protein [Belliella pelovolcani]|uniref:JAB domain-containing protein n=1 Tax=Belliella pelovolcani TaxID=529505 RepID=UPI00391C642A
MKNDAMNAQLLPLRENWTVARFKIQYSLSHTGIFVNSSDDAYRIFYAMWDHSLINLQEQANALYLNMKDEVIGFRNICTGTANGIHIDTTMLMTCALLSKSRRVILAHNHPNGYPHPSKADFHTTRELHKVLGLLNINLIDHLIITEKEHFSFADSTSILT